jgi:hypothetical protein
MANPTDPKVYAAAGAAGLTAAVVVLALNLINKEPLDQVALETVLTSVVAFVLAVGAGWLKSTPLETLRERVRANESAGPSDHAL